MTYNEWKKAYKINSYSELKAEYCSDDRFLTFDDELNGVISALNISDLIDLSIIADDIAENDLVHYCFGRAFISNA